jgi:hypothetical protein
LLQVQSDGFARSNFDRWRHIMATKPTRSEPSSSASFVPFGVVAEQMDFPLVAAFHPAGFEVTVETN